MQEVLLKQTILRRGEVQHPVDKTIAVLQYRRYFYHVSSYLIWTWSNIRTEEF